MLDARVRSALAGVSVPDVRRVAVTFVDHTGGAWTTLWYVPDADAPDGWREEAPVPGMHPMIGERLQLWRLAEFDLERLPASPEVVLLRCTAKENPADQRLVVLAEVRDFTVGRDGDGNVVALPEVEHVLSVAVAELRDAQVNDQGGSPDWNRVVLYLWPDIDVPLAELERRRRPAGADHTRASVWSRCWCTAGWSTSGGTHEVVVRIAAQPGTGVTLNLTAPPTEPMRARDEYARNVVRARQRGAVYPFEIVPLITQRPDGSAGSFTELDLADPDGFDLVPVEREPGANRAGIVVGLVRTPTATHPDGIERVALFGDPLKALGSLAEPECRRIIGAIELATERSIPIEWFALSAGAKISMDSGVENMDWIARALRWIVRFTQAGGEINVIVAGINVGAQPYWNAEATMLMHTKGILVMTPDGAMVLTGKHALDYSGGVSAEDNFGIGGYDRIMGPERPGPVLGARSGRCGRRAVQPLRPRLRGAGRAVPPPGRDDRPVRPRRAAGTPPRRARDWPRSGRSSASRATPAARSRSTSGPCCGRSPIRTTNCSSGGPTCATPTPPSWSTPTSVGSRSR